MVYWTPKYDYEVLISLLYKVLIYANLLHIVQMFLQI